MTGRVTRLFLAAVILAMGIGGASAERVAIVIQGLSHGEEALVDIISVDNPRQRQAFVFRNTSSFRFRDPLWTGVVSAHPSYIANLPPGAYTVYVRDMETGEHWPSQTFFVRGGRNADVVMRRRDTTGFGEGGAGQGGQGGNN